MRTPPVKKKLFWPILWAVCLHALLFALLFVSYSHTPDLPPSRPIVKATLYQLESQNQASSQTSQKIAGEAEKTAAKQFDHEQLEQKKRQEQEAAAKRKAEQERQVAAKKAADDKKKAEEQKRAAEQKAAEQKAAEQRKLEQQKAEAAKKIAADKAKAEKAEAERKKAAEEKKKAEEAAKQKALAEQKKKDAEQAAKLAAEKAREAARKAKEDKEAAALAELLQQETQYQRAMADKQGEQDIANINDLIIQLVSSHWIRPAGARNGMQVEVRVEIMPDGTIKHAAVSKSSGNQAFDNSAVAAILSVGRVREIQNLDRAIYEKTYRQLVMAFRPEDLGL